MMKIPSFVRGVPGRGARLAASCLSLAGLLAGSPTALAAGVSGQGTWETTLQARDFDQDGDADAYYDTVLDVTWLADMNLALTSGYSPPVTDGQLSWNNAKTYVASLTLGNVSGWRLPSLLDLGTAGCAGVAYGGSECGYNVLDLGGDGTVYSELAHLFFQTLGNVSRFSAPGVQQAGYGLQNTGPFLNIGAGKYWTSTPGPSTAFYFNMGLGLQYVAGTDSGMYAALVHDGDVSPVLPPPVPEPGTATLLALGLASGLVRRACRAKAKP